MHPTDSSSGRWGILGKLTHERPYSVLTDCRCTKPSHIPLWAW